MKIFRLIQEEQFPEEITALQTGKELPKSIKLLQFDPFLEGLDYCELKDEVAKVN